jgi:hypothetical protein
LLTEWLLLKDEEDGVDELDVLDVIVNHVVRDEALWESAGQKACLWRVVG